MSESGKSKSDRGHSSIGGAVLIAWFAFWMGNGYERVDCSLGIQAACNSIAARYSR